MISTTRNHKMAELHISLEPNGTVAFATEAQVTIRHTFSNEAEDKVEEPDALFWRST